MMDMEMIYEEAYQKYKDNEDFKYLEPVIHLLEDKDPVTFNHCKRVAALSAMLSEELEYDEDEVIYTFNSAIVHDIGKLNISDDIMAKSKIDLTNEERGIIQKHPLYGVSVMKDIDDEVKYVIPVVTLHHEYMDGTGLYNIDGELLMNRIGVIEVCDCFDAMTVERRPNDHIYTYEEALDTMKEKRNNQLNIYYIEELKNMIYNIALGGNI